MENRSSKGLRVFAIGFTVFILLVFSFVLLRTATRQILVKHMGITNGFTDVVLFDVENLNEAPEEPETDEEGNIINTVVDIDWKALYPFTYSGAEENEATQTVSQLDGIKETIDSIESNITTYVTDFLPFYKNMTELAGNYEQVVLWNFSPASEYNNVTVRDGGYLIGMQAEEDVSESAESTIELANYCKNQGAEFVYIEYPNKVCEDEDSDISGTMDFSNQNADEFLERLSDSGVLTYDLRTELHDEELDHHSLFFNTDHHWKPQTGLWASQHILEFLNESFGRNFDTEILNNENYDEKIYKDWFLGSQGKKVTLSVCEPDDISLIYPKYNTSIHYEIPSLAIDEYGSFDITYDMDCIEEKDYYNKNPYAAYDYADQALIKIENELIDDDAHVLIVHNSFSNCVIPFMAMGIKNVDAIDLRYFTGSLQSYISQEKPDIVIVAYQSVPGSVDYTTKHKDMFDFR